MHARCVRCGALSYVPYLRCDTSLLPPRGFGPSLTGRAPHSGPGWGPLTVRRTGSAVTVTSRGSTANVVAADVGTGDGIVHVVDAVLLPFYTTLAQVGASVPLSLPLMGGVAYKARVYNLEERERVSPLCRSRA